METTDSTKRFTCEECGSKGVIEYNNITHMPVTKPKWFSLRLNGCGVAEDLCSIECVCERLKKKKFNRQTVASIGMTIIGEPI